ncbi:MAG: DUF4249 family protein [Paludibacteraceae bacterium]|nr:DUF4249 family protein [Paludibacteraceae bacterium]
MKKTAISYYLFLLLLLTGCEEMFYREVDFSVEGEHEMLVVNTQCQVGGTFVANINHSVLANKAVSMDGKNTGVTDAEVLVRANGGEWHRLYNRAESSAYYMPDSVSFSSRPIAFQPLDTVEMQITHPDYPAASVRQILPGTVNARILGVLSVQEGWIAMIIEFDPYHGNPDDIIGIGLESGTALMANKVDTTDRRAQPLELEYIYTTSTNFALLQNIQSEGYYAGSKDEFLFLPASLLQDTLRTVIFADGRFKGNSRLRRENYFPVGVMNLSLEMRAYTHDSYLYESFRRNIRGSYIPAPTGVPTSDENIVQEILDEIASFLGGQELIPPFTNIEGGLGCFHAYSSAIVRSAE